MFDGVYHLAGRCGASMSALLVAAAVHEGFEALSRKRDGPDCRLNLMGERFMQQAFRGIRNLYH